MEAKIFLLQDLTFNLLFCVYLLIYFCIYLCCPRSLCGVFFAMHLVGTKTLVVLSFFRSASDACLGWTCATCTPAACAAAEVVGTLRWLRCLGVGWGAFLWVTFLETFAMYFGLVIFLRYLIIQDLTLVLVVLKLVFIFSPFSFMY